MMPCGDAGRDVAVRLPDGRALSVRAYGDPAKPLVLYFGGLISSRLEASLFLDDRFFIVGIDRPGYGGSDFNPRQNAVSFADDIVRVMGEFGRSECRIFTYSGGLAFALAFASVHPERVLKIGGFAGLSPAGSVPLGRCYIAKFPFFTAFPIYLRLNVNWRCLLYRLPPRLLHALLRFDPATLDIERRALEPRVLAVLTKSFREALRPGTDGLLADLRMHLGDWGGCDLRNVHAPVMLFHGLSDDITPVVCTEWYEKNLKDCSARYFEGETHLSVPILHHGAMYDWLSD
ncbi:alpha/beta hydrolase [Azospirillum sp. sgz302134]